MTLRIRLFARYVVPVLLAGCAPVNLVEVPRLLLRPEPIPGWSGGGVGTGLSSTDANTGRNAAFLSNTALATPIQRVLSQQVRADQYRGKRVRLSGSLKPFGVASQQYSGLWMRVDGPSASLAFDNMQNRPVVGTGDWKRMSIVLDVDSSAIGIIFGALFEGSNTLLVDDLTLEIVGTQVVVTNLLTAPTPSGRDSSATARAYDRSPQSASNLGFEGVETGSTVTIDWIRSNAVALTTTDPTVPLDDLDSLRSMVGSAQIVGLGEATHGTKEFFLLKHRMVRYLVTRMGFTTFAIEASAPEADELNAYVLNGVGTPSLLLFNLRFWIWDTRELLDMIRWMREWNISAPASQRVSFRGIDIQYPGASIDSVVSYISREAPSEVASVVAGLACMDPYRNRGSTPGQSRSGYAQSAPAAKASCAAALADVHRRVTAQRAGAAGYAAAVHHARLVQQFEAMIAEPTAGVSSVRRDEAMADNVAWLREQSGGQSRIIVWAHNEHITRQSGSMGANLDARYGTAYRPVGLTFGTGSFYAVLLQNGVLRDVRVQTSTLIRSNSLEAAFLGTEAPLLLLDLRRTLRNDAGADPLRRALLMRNIGSAFDPQNELVFYATRVFPTDFDVMLFVKSGTPATSLLLP